MLKKFFIMLVCILVTSSFTIASAHDNFTWFGLRRNNTEIMFKTSDKHKHCKKGPNYHKWWKKH